MIHFLLGDSYGWAIMLAGRFTHLIDLNINPILDDRRVLHERMKHIARLSLSDMWTLTLGYQYTARQQESADLLCGKDGLAILLDCIQAS